MYIITERHGVFNTDAIPVILDDGRHIYALCDGIKYPISYDIEDKAKIISALKVGESYVVLGEEHK